VPRGACATWWPIGLRVSGPWGMGDGGWVGSVLGHQGRALEMGGLHAWGMGDALEKPTVLAISDHCRHPSSGIGAGAEGGVHGAKAVCSTSGGPIVTSQGECRQYPSGDLGFTSPSECTHHHDIYNVLIELTACRAPLPVLVQRRCTRSGSS
jgi:hypothetical protein